MKNSLKLTLALILTFCAISLWAGNTGRAYSWDGEGTQQNPYIIMNDEQFLLLANLVNAGDTEVSHSYFKLGADITFGTEQEPDTTMVGFSKSRRFYGHFDGDGHTLNVYMVRDKNFAAPFGIADGSTFTNLNVEGTIITDHKFAGGIASYVYGKNNGPVNVTNCNSNIHIISNVTVPSNHDGTHAGFVGQCEEGTINFENCVFTGSIIDPVEPHQTIKCAGFLGWVNNTANYTRCLQAGTIDVESYMATFQRNKKGASINYTNAYYINGFNDNQGTQALGIVPDSTIVRRYLINTTPYYIPGVEISGIYGYYYTDGNPVTVAPVVTYFSNELIEGNDYTVTFKIKNGDVYNTVTQVTEAGDYKIKIEGAGDYTGTYTDTFRVIAITNDWVELQSLLDADGTVVLNKNYIANSDDEALIVNGDVTIDMNSHIIDRAVNVAKEDGYVIKVNKNASLTIIDNSKDKANAITGGNTIGNGGGIYNEGKLTIENLNISGNRTIRNSKVYGTGAGIYSTGTLLMTNCNVSDNVGDGGGGGIHALGGLTISGGSVSDNKTFSKGAGIRVTGKNSTITDCVITNNSIITGANIKNGGGIYVDGSNGAIVLTITRCTITNNTAIENGGGIYVMNSSVIAKDCTISNNSASLGNDIYLYQNCTINIEGSTTTTNTSANDIFAYSNAQVIVPTNSTFLATVQNNTITWNADHKTGWSPISSPIENQLFENVTNLQSAIHNIYRYDAESTVWQEYRDGHNLFDRFETGRGYLYRRASAATITYSGTLNSGDVSYDLAYTEGNDLKSYNLIGNPYSHTIYKGVNISNDFLEEKYCLLNTDGTWQVMDDSEAIPVGTAILVQATAAKTLKITNEGTSSKERSNNDNIWFTVSNNEFKDVACIEFKNGHGFNKVAHRNEDAPMLYINHNGENFASVDMSDDTDLINLNFKTNKTGKFTLSYKANGMFNYLHLIDRLTGADVDLLLDEEYSFIASSKDDESRFIVRMNYQGAPSNSDDHFAYQNGNDIIVNGEGTLQIFDMTGRLVSTANVQGVETMCTSSMQTGLYIFRLIGNEIKTQKIIVR
ncbi:MAG: T9SS type A sorting domain-containing protein [Bacteroidales bacterium]|nr:T9SS type A sorting domain-containing protein [Bacteroidales bacterium]